MKKSLLILLSLLLTACVACSGKPTIPDELDSQSDSSAPVVSIITVPTTTADDTDATSDVTTAEPKNPKIPSLILFESDDWRVTRADNEYTLFNLKSYSVFNFELDKSTYFKIGFDETGMYLVTDDDCGYYSYNDMIDKKPSEFKLYPAQITESNLYRLYYASEIGGTIVIEQNDANRTLHYYPYIGESFDYDGSKLVFLNDDGKYALLKEPTNTIDDADFKWTNIDHDSDDLVLNDGESFYEWVNGEPVKLKSDIVFDKYVLCVRKDNHVLELRSIDGEYITAFYSRTGMHELDLDNCIYGGDKYIFSIKYHDDNYDYTVKYRYPMPTLDELNADGTKLYNFEYEDLYKYMFILYEDDYFYVEYSHWDGYSIEYVNISPNEFPPENLIAFKPATHEGLIFADKDLNMYRLTTYNANTSRIEKNSYDELRCHGTFAGFKYGGDDYEDDLGVITDGDGNLIAQTYGTMYVKDDFLITYANYCGTDTSYTIFNTSLDMVSGKPLYKYSFLGDGRLLVIPIIVDENGIPHDVFQIYSPTGELEFESREYDEIFSVADGLVLVMDDNKCKLLDIGENELAVLFENEENLHFEGHTEGYYDKKYVYSMNENQETQFPSGYYYAFENYPRTDEHPDEAYEFCYIPETGEVKRFPSYVGAMSKPVLYLYPTEPTDVTVTFEHPEILTTVYPAYNSGWHAHADVDGTLTDGRRSYYALYWEEAMYTNTFRFTDGFCVTADNAATFLEEKLDTIGLTEREANEFIMYWLPVLEKNKISIVHFELTESREATNALHISPAPDSLLRIAMHILPVDEITSISEQKLPHFERHGFTAVEWGGRNY